VSDERNGDDLFEDLDKFFAPIKDVDWDEPEEPAGTAPREEHVAVRAEEPTAQVEEPPSQADEPPSRAEEPPGPAAPEPPPPPALEIPDEDEDVAEAWYDTGVLEPIEAAEPDLTVDTGETVRIIGQEPEVDESQADLFAEEPPLEPGAVEPSEDDLEAAAEHFAGSIREEERYDTAPLGDDFEDDEEPEPSATVGADLLAEPGPDEVEEDILADLETEEEPRTVVVGAGGEGLGGPSWQEPAAVEVGADIERRGPNVGDRDVPAAFMTGLVLAGVALAALLVGEPIFAVVAALAVVAAQGELFGVMTKHHLQPATFVGLVSGQLIVWGAYFRGEAAIPAMFALGLIATSCWFMTVPAQHRKQVVQNIGVTVLNVAWIALLAAYLVAMLELPDGRELVIAVIALTFVFDTAAFFVGSVWGGSFFQRPLAASISPKKSLEGLIGGALVVIVVSVAMLPTGFIELFDGRRVDALLLGVVIAVAATLGDLAESLIKRDLGIKDMGSVLPGHGGVLDRIDSLLFVAPAAYFLFRVVFV
jgi:phosphatidate cytidylyltransferase